MPIKAKPKKKTTVSLKVHTEKLRELEHLDAVAVATLERVEELTRERDAIQIQFDLEVSRVQLLQQQVKSLDSALRTQAEKKRQAEATSETLADVVRTYDQETAWVTIKRGFRTAWQDLVGIY